ncbi:MAG: rhodanese-related sulfurtransferase [Wigglesworthia glossinidia]|nr:rhodanese-related sulfurtransferase [Wigglesworthia glossinidia]
MKILNHENTDMENFNKKSICISQIKKTISFYRYFNIKNPKQLQIILLQKFHELNILGRVYIAHEGINAQISIFQKYIYMLKKFLCELNSVFKKVKLNLSIDNHVESFCKLKIKIRPYILNDGITDPTFNMKKIGKSISIKKFNNMCDYLLVDVRNSYEYEIGHFKNAMHIPANTFRNQITNITTVLKNFKFKKIILYCTGGIRCEKASAWLIHNKFEYVYFLKGGIINYVNYMIKRNSPLKFIGKMFVFDSRLYESITPHTISYCYQCKINKSYLHKNCQRKKCNFLFLQCIQCNKKFYEFCSSYCYNHKDL